MVRLVLCALQLLPAVAFSMPGCAKTSKALRAPGPLEGPSGLCVGSEAPDIAGEDIDGAFFKLSDYRGNVVLLDFWGHW